MDPKVRPVRQRRRKFNEESRQVIKEETKKLLSAGCRTKWCSSFEESKPFEGC